MTIVGFIGALLGLLSFSWAFVHRTNGRVALYMTMWLMHLATAVIYYLYVQTHPADTLLYYDDPYHFAEYKTGPGTWFTIGLVQGMKSRFGGTYLDYFLLFQAIGFWGLTLVARAVEEVTLELQIRQPLILYMCLFLPGLYFWTSAIGKDAPLFFGTALAAWSVIQIQRRYVWFGVAVITMFPFRPHIALIALVALASALAIDKRTSFIFRALLLMVVLASSIAVMATVRSAMSVDVSSASSIADFVVSQNQIQVAAGESLAGASYPVKLFSQLFRPFFFDASGALGIIASFENLLLMIIFITFARHWRLLIELTRNVAFIRYSMIFSVTLILFLSAIFYNVGLGLRQKTMMMPTLIVVYAVVMAVALVRRRSRLDDSDTQTAGSSGSMVPAPR